MQLFDLLEFQRRCVTGTGIFVLAGHLDERGVALGGKSRWVKNATLGANINALNPGLKADMGASTAVHGVEVTIRKV